MEVVNYIWFYFPNLTAMIKVDQKLNPYIFTEMQLGRDRVPAAFRTKSFNSSESAVGNAIISRNGEVIARRTNKGRKRGELESK